MVVTEQSETGNEVAQESRGRETLERIGRETLVTCTAVTLAIGANGDSVVTEGIGDSLASEGDGDTLATGGNVDTQATEGDGDTLATRRGEDIQTGLDTLDMEGIDESEEGPALSCRQEGIILITGTEF